MDYSAFFPVKRHCPVGHRVGFFMSMRNPRWFIRVIFAVTAICCAGCPMPLRGQSDPIVLASGVLVMRAASDPDYPLKKPVTGGYLQDSDLIGFLVTEDGRSKKRNLNLVISDGNLNDDLKVFKHRWDPEKKAE